MATKIDMVVSQPYTETEGAKVGFDLAGKLNITCANMVVVEGKVLPVTDTLLEGTPATIISCDDTLITSVYLNTSLADIEDEFFNQNPDIFVQCEVLKHEVNAIENTFELECSFT